LGDLFPFRTFFLTSKASPNGLMIVIVDVIIVIGEANWLFHDVRIIA